MTKWNDDYGREDDPFGPSFSLNDFKKWMDQQNDTPNRGSNIQGLAVESKIGVKKLITKMQIEEGDIEEIAREFRSEGGVIAEVDGTNLVIDVDSGRFCIHRMYVKRV